MPTLITHAAAGMFLIPIQGGFRRGRMWIAAASLSMFPDLDAIGLKWGIPYSSLWGHRGLSHSILFAIGLSGLAAWLVGREGRSSRDEGGDGNGAARWLLFSVVTLLHGFLDSMTSGGLGVAFFSPLEQTRYFLPWRPIQVASFGVRWLASVKGLRVLESEFLWVWLPLLSLILVLTRLRRGKKIGTSPQDISTFQR